jgi:integrase
MARGTVHKRELKDGSIRWDAIADMRDPVTGKRKQPKATFRTEREAEQWLTERQGEIHKGIAVTRDRQTVGTYLDYWLTNIAQHRVRPTTFASYRQIIHNRIVSVLGAVELQKLAPAQVQALYSSLLAGGRVDGRGKALSPRSVKYAHTILRSALKDAVKLGLVSRNVCDATTPPKAPRPPVQCWDMDEVRTFLEVARTDRFAALWILALHTGMRRGELLALRWRDVDLDAGTCTVRQSLVQSGGIIAFQEPKTSSGRRTIALDATCIAALREHRARQNEQRLKMGEMWQDTGLLFTTETGTHLYPSNVNRYTKALMAKAGVQRIPFHGLRHTHATLLMKHGVQPKVASERLGHAGIAITLATYSHVLPQMQQQAADIFAAAVAGR